MPKYHLNEAGEPGVCRAKKQCPFGDLLVDHFPTKDDARSFYEQRSEMELKASLVKTFPQHPATTRALTAPLEPIDVHPEWFTELEQKGLEVFGVKAEIVDVIDGPSGPASVVWEKNSTEKMDTWSQLERGYAVSRISVRDMDTGEEFGHLTSTYASDESIKLSFGDDDYTGLRYCEDASGSSYGLKAWDDNDKPYDPLSKAVTEEEVLAVKKSVWAKAHDSFKVKPESMDPDDPRLRGYGRFNITAKDAPTDPTVLESDLAQVKELGNQRLAEFRKNSGTPSIDYSKIEDAYRGQGLGTSLYVYSARMLAKQGLPLRASGLQSDEAERAWARMVADPAIPTAQKARAYLHEGKVVNRTSYYQLDFRS